MKTDGYQRVESSIGTECDCAAVERKEGLHAGAQCKKNRDIQKT